MDEELDLKAHELGDLEPYVIKAECVCELCPEECVGCDTGECVDSTSCTNCWSCTGCVAAQ